MSISKGVEFKCKKCGQAIIVYSDTDLKVDKCVACKKDPRPTKKIKPEED